MLKKILSLTLCLCICFGVVFSATSCGSDEGKKNPSSSTAKVPTTLSFLGITSEETDPENVKMVEEALNEIFAARFKTKIDLTLVTEDKYMDLVEERIQLAKDYKIYDDAIAQYNTYIKNQANKTSTSTDKIFGNWISGEVKVTLDTLATRLVYVSEQTTVHEDGRVETLYPEAPSPVDIVMIVDEKMYDDFTDMGLLMEKAIDSTLTPYKNLQKYIYPTFFSELNNLKGKVNAIPNNNMLAESTYLVVKKDLAEKYDFDIEAFKNYSDLSSFLALVKANEEIVPFKNVPDALGIFKLFSEDVAIGAYLDPLVGYNPEEGEKYSKMEIKNLFEIKEYTNHVSLMEEYTKLGYFSRDEYVLNGFAVEVIKGDASVKARYDNEESEYLVKEIQVPFVLREAIFDGMLAPTAYTSNLERSLEIIEAINTDPEVKNLLQYGIEEYNYIPNTETGSIIPLNGSYIMDNTLTGNVYMGYVPYEPDAEKVTAWSYVMQTNLAALSSPFLLFPVDEAYLQQNLKGIINRAGLAEALAAIDISYNDYVNPKTTSIGAQYQNMLRNNYKTYLVEQLVEQGKAASTEVAENLVKTVAITWVEETVAKQYVDEKYSNIATLEEIETLVGTKLAGSVVGAESFALYEKARENASKYLANIKNLRVIAKITIFADMTQEEYDAKYGVLGALDFEKAVYDYLRANYEKENNLTEADYEKLVQDFIASNFKFTDRVTRQEYSYTWEEFLAIKEEAAKFSTPLQAVREKYSSLITELGGATQAKINSWDDITLANNLLETFRTRYYNSQNTSDTEFADTLYNSVILAPFSITKKELDVLRVKDNALYKDYLTKVKKTYKNQLLENYTKDEYAAMTDSAALTAVLEYYIEVYTQAYATLCAEMGMSRKDYEKYYDFAEKYINCVDTKMRKAFIYSLRTVYTEEEINAMTIPEAEKAVYDLVYESGYYMNELAKCIGVNLSAYNSAKSEALDYLGDPNDPQYKPGKLTDVIRHYEADLLKKGYTIAQARALDTEVVEGIIREIIREKYFAEYITIDVALAELCKDYIAGVDSYDKAEYDDIADYCNSAATELSDNYLFSAIVGYLNDALQAKLAK